MNQKHQIIICLVIVLSCLNLRAEMLTWNIRAEYGGSAEGIQEAVNAAKIHFGKAPDDVIVLEFDKGSFHLENRGPGKGTIDLSGIKPGVNGRLVFQGKGMEETILVFADNKHALYGRAVHRVTFADMHMTRKDYTVSQGVVVNVAPGKVVLDIHPGFPAPDMIFNSLSKQGRYLRKYTSSTTNPQIVEKDNEQLPWLRCTHIEGQRWQLDLSPKTRLANYSKGDLIGIKSKHSKGDTEFGGQTYWFYSGSDFLFRSVKWTHKSRGVFRGGFEKVQLVNCVVDRAPAINGQTPCLATPGGGPQIGQPNDPPTSGHLVKNCRFIALGDDAVAFFNATGTISGCYIRDSFVRGILVANAPKTELHDNTVIRCPIQTTKHWQFHKTEKKAKLF